MVEATRLAEHGDSEVLYNLAEAARLELTDKKGGDVAERLDPARSDPGLRLVNSLDEGDSVLHLGTIDGVPVGYGLLSLRTLEDGSVHGVIEELFVEPEARSVGIGELLLLELVHEARERGAAAIQSTALPGDRATKNFFETQGMVARALIVHRWLNEE